MSTGFSTLCGSHERIIMKHYLFLLLVFLLTACSNVEMEQNDNPEIEGYIRILQGDKAVEYFSKYMTLSAEQESQVVTIANEFQNELQGMDGPTRMKNQGRYTIKFVSKIIREVMTMEQAELYVKEDRAAQQLFGEE